MGNVIPDVIVEKIDGGIRVTVNDDGMPSPRLLKMMGEDLRKNIEEHRQDLVQVTKTIVTVQRYFLDQGIDELKSMSLRQIADVAGVHESTVSRVIKDTCVQTPQDIHKLKLFFATPKSDSGEMISAPRMKALIGEMIEFESSLKPLSD